MEREGFVHALAGLLIDPIFDSEIKQIVSGGWMEAIAEVRKSKVAENTIRRILRRW